MRVHYTKEKLGLIVKKSSTWADVCRHFKVATSGGTQAHIKSRADKFGIDYSHFKGRAWSRGRSFQSRRRSAKDILLKRTEGNRTRHVQLSRALQEMGVEYRCVSCRISDWRCSPIVLEVDHINGNPLDDRQNNLQFLCPNCHSQTPTYKNKKR